MVPVDSPPALSLHHACGFSAQGLAGARAARAAHAQRSDGTEGEASLLALCRGARSPLVSDPQARSITRGPELVLRWAFRWCFSLALCLSFPFGEQHS